LTVLPSKKVPAWSGVGPHGKYVTTTGNPVEVFPSVPAGEAISKRYLTDAHVTLVGIWPKQGWQNNECPRFNSRSPALLDNIQAQFPNGGIGGCALFLDFDLPGKSDWSDDLRIKAEMLFASAGRRNPLLQTPTCFYMTAHGCRLVYVLTEPVPVEGPRGLPDLLAGLICQAHMVGPMADLACSDWTRLFRLPRVMRNGAPTDQEPFWAMSWGRVDVRGRELASPKEIVAYAPTAFRGASEITLSELEQSAAGPDVIAKWHQWTSSRELSTVHGWDSIEDMPSPEDAQALLVTSDGLTSLGKQVIAHLDRSLKRATTPAITLEAHIRQGKPVFTNVADRTGFHDAMGTLVRSAYTVLTSLVTNGSIGPPTIFGLLWGCVAATNATIDGQRQRAERDLAGELWRWIGGVYQRHKSGVASPPDGIIRGNGLVRLPYTPPASCPPPPVAPSPQPAKDELRAQVRSAIVASMDGQPAIRLLEAAAGIGKTTILCEEIKKRPNRSVVIAAPTQQDRDAIAERAQIVAQISLDEASCKRLADGDDTPRRHQQSGHVLDAVCNLCQHRQACLRAPGGYLGGKEAMTGAINKPENPLRIAVTIPWLVGNAWRLMPDDRKNRWDNQGKNAVYEYFRNHVPMLLIEEDITSQVWSETRVTAGDLVGLRNEMYILLDKHHRHLAGKDAILRAELSHLERQLASWGRGRRRRRGMPLPPHQALVHERKDTIERELAPLRRLEDDLRLLDAVIGQLARELCPGPLPPGMNRADLHSLDGGVAQSLDAGSLQRFATGSWTHLKAGIRIFDRTVPEEIITAQTHPAEMSQDGEQLPPGSWRRRIWAQLVSAIRKSTNDPTVWREWRRGEDSPADVVVTSASVSLARLVAQSNTLFSDATLDEQLHKALWPALAKPMACPSPILTTVAAPHARRIRWAIDVTYTGINSAESIAHAVQAIYRAHGRVVGALLLKKHLEEVVRVLLEDHGLRVHCLTDTDMDGDTARTVDADILIGTWGKHHRAFDGFRDCSALVLGGSYRLSTTTFLRRASCMRAYGISLPSQVPTLLAYSGRDTRGNAYARYNRSLYIDNAPDANFLYQVERRAALRQGTERLRSTYRALEGRPPAEIYLIGPEPIHDAEFEADLISIRDLLAGRVPAADVAARQAWDSGLRSAERLVDEMRRRGVVGASDALRDLAQRVCLAGAPSVKDALHAAADAAVVEGCTTVVAVVAALRRGGHHGGNAHLQEIAKMSLRRRTNGGESAISSSA